MATASRMFQVHRQLPAGRQAQPEGRARGSSDFERLDLHGRVEIEGRRQADRVSAEVEGGPLDRFLCRAIFVVGPDDTVQHVEYVGEIAEEPNYDAALAAATA